MVRRAMSKKKAKDIEKERGAFVHGDASRGMGIGLSVCGSIIKAHNGLFEADNRPEGGAVFRVCLPMKQETEVNSHE